MSWRYRIRGLAVGVAALLVVAACGSSNPSTVGAASAKSAAEMGGMSALVTAAKAEGKLNVIALPPDWCNYPPPITAFTAKYAINVTSDHPNGSSQQEADPSNRPRPP